MLHVGGCVLCGESLAECQCATKDLTAYRESVKAEAKRQEAISAATRKVVEAAEEQQQEHAVLTDPGVCLCEVCQAVRDLKALEAKP